MDFQSLKQGSPIYILQEGGSEPQLTIATVANKPEPKPKYMTQTPGATPNIYAGTNMMQPVVEVVAHIGNEDIPFSNLTPTATTASYNNGQTTISCTKEGMLSAIDAMKGSESSSSVGAVARASIRRCRDGKGKRVLDGTQPPL